MKASAEKVVWTWRSPKRICFPAACDGGTARNGRGGNRRPGRRTGLLVTPATAGDEHRHDDDSWPASHGSPPSRMCPGSPTTRHRAGGTEVAGTRARLARRGLRASLPGLLFRLVAARRCDGAERETHREDGTVAVVAAPSGNRPAVQLDDLPGNGEAEPKTPVCAAGGETDLFEAMEDAGQEVGRNAGPRVADGEPRLGLERLETDVNATALGGELDRVAEEVGDDLTQPGRVASHQELAPADGHQLE